MQTKKLVIKFKNEFDKTYNLSLKDVKESLSLSEVRQAAETLINENAFFSSGGDLISFEGAVLETKITEELV